MRSNTFPNGRSDDVVKAWLAEQGISADIVCGYTIQRSPRESTITLVCHFDDVEVSAPEVSPVSPRTVSEAFAARFADGGFQVDSWIADRAERKRNQALFVQALVDSKESYPDGLTFAEVRGMVTRVAPNVGSASLRRAWQEVTDSDCERWNDVVRHTIGARWTVDPLEVIEQ